MEHAPGLVGTHVDNCYWWRANYCNEDHLLVTNSGLLYFTLKLHIIFHFLQENLKKISYMLLSILFSMYIFNQKISCLQV